MEDLKSTVPPISPLVQAEADIVDTLHQRMHDACQDIIPILKLYVADIRGFRMSLANEINDIMRSTSELKELTKLTPAIDALVKSLGGLEKAMTPEVKELLGKLGK